APALGAVFGFVTLVIIAFFVWRCFHGPQNKDLPKTRKNWERERKEMEKRTKLGPEQYIAEMRERSLPRNKRGSGTHQQEQLQQDGGLEEIVVSNQPVLS
ncbi:hypothetical protein HK102_001787, partial [Quaeritorhiza haematococci]